MAKQADVWDLLQIADSAFPTGGFSHSIGLEAAAKTGHVNSFETFKVFIKSALQNAASFSLPYVTEAYKHYGDLDHVMHLDNRLHAYTSNHVTKRASIRQGTSLLNTSCSAFKKPEFDRLKEQLESDEIHGHHAPMIGFICAVFGIPLLHTQQMYMFSTLRNILSSAVRLGHIGPIEAQNLHFQCKDIAEQLRLEYADTPVKLAANTAPIVDIIQGTHDQLFAKLFYS